MHSNARLDAARGELAAPPPPASPSAAFTTSLAPSLRASSSFHGTVSTAMIRPAPAIRAPCSAESPTPPQPITATLLPGAICAVLSAAPTPVVTPQPISAACSSGMSSRIFTSAFSCTSICSAKPERCANWRDRLAVLRDAAAARRACASWPCRRRDSCARTGSTCRCRRRPRGTRSRDRPAAGS